MSSLQSSIIDRKAKLAALKNKSLKRKAPESDATISSEPQPNHEPAQSEETAVRESDEQVEARQPDTSVYLSGRNYDSATRGPKLGFENNPSDSTNTLEARAQALALAAKETETQKEEAENANVGSSNNTVAGVDLFQLRPKKATWDLKRELAERMRVLDVRTENAIARLVRERIKGQQGKGNGSGGGGLEGPDLAEAVKVREMQEEEDERRERELLEED